MIPKVHRLAYRIRQLAGYMVVGDLLPISQSASTSLLPETIEIFRQLSPGDQRHLLSVHAILLDSGVNEDLLRAGLLHDIGKVYNGQRIGVASRSLKVVMAAVAPGILDRILLRPTPPPLVAGLWIAGNHARLGAELLREQGYPARVCWLVAHHEEKDVGGSDLSLLKAADNSTLAVPKR